MSICADCEISYFSSFIIGDSNIKLELLINISLCRKPSFAFHLTTHYVFYFGKIEIHFFHGIETQIK